MEVKFYDNMNEIKLQDPFKYAIIIARSNGKWVFCKHKDRDTYEIPGGHREPDEDIFDTARRELIEETGAIDFILKPICVYSVTETTTDNKMNETFGMLYFADIKSFEQQLHYEIEKIIRTDKLIENWTYPLIQPLLIQEAVRRQVI